MRCVARHVRCFSMQSVTHAVGLTTFRSATTIHTVCCHSSCFTTSGFCDSTVWCHRQLLLLVNAGVVQPGHAARACFHHDTLQGAQLHPHGEHASQSSQASNSPASPQPQDGPSGADWNSPCQAVCNCSCCHGITRQRLRVSTMPVEKRFAVSLIFKKCALCVFMFNLSQNDIFC